jgi:hypothetical protein
MKGRAGFLTAKPDPQPVRNSEQPVQFFSVDEIRRLHRRQTSDS